MRAYLETLSDELPERPKALLVISAHWEAENFTVQSKSEPELLYDYYGFPPHTYALQWPAMGAPSLARRVIDLAAQAGIRVDEDAERDFDHGVFIPLKLAFPLADIPTIQVSLKSGLSPAAHYELGQALAPLRREGVLIIGSGLSFHNLRAFFSDASGRAHRASTAFDQWLKTALVGDRKAALNQWASAAEARFCHPREEHLLPLMVVAGAAGGDPLSVPYTESDFGTAHLALSAFHFSETTAQMA
jgi:aromatic ring-opening dioxygenase catalytic subunit (LigB family)